MCAVRVSLGKQSNCRNFGHYRAKNNYFHLGSHQQQQNKRKIFGFMRKEKAFCITQLIEDFHV